MSEDGEKKAFTLRWIFVAAFSLLIALLLLTLSWSTWYIYRGEVERIKRQSQETKHQIALLAERTLLSLLNRVAEVLSRADLDEASLSELPISHWEVVSAGGRVLFSNLSAGRIGQPPGYQTSWRRIRGWSDVEFDVSSVVRLPQQEHPTVLIRVPVRAGGGGASRVAFIDPKYLHRWLTSQFDSFVNRHVYAVDAEGRPIFYSDMELTNRPGAFAENPPVVHFLRGEAGPIRYESAISGRQRVAHVLRIEEAGWGLVVSGDIETKLLDIRKRFLWVLIALLACGAFAAMVFFYFNRRVIEPLVEITREIRQDDRLDHALLELPPAARNIREFRSLVRDVNDYIIRTRQAEKEAIRAEKLATIGELAAGLAHEVGTPLNVMRGNAQLLMRKMAPSDPARGILEKIVGQTNRIEDLIRTLLDLARMDSSSPIPVSIGLVLIKALNTIGEMFPAVAVEEKTGGELPCVIGFPRNLEHAFLNLLVNGCQAMDDKGTLRVTAFADETGEGRKVRITIEDTGCGIDPGDLPQIFKPFFSTKSSGKGTGLGLAIVERVIREHNGTIGVASTLGEGTRFEVVLPASTDEETDPE